MSTRARPMAATEPVAAQGESAAELGRRLKMLRVGRGLTLKDIERRGRISATHVSEVERGKASPTVGALGKIALALGLRPALLVWSASQARSGVTRAADRNGSLLQWGGVRIEALMAPLHASDLSLHLFTLPIGRDSALTHTHAGEEWLTVLSGVCEIRVATSGHVLRAGDSLHFRATDLHAYANLGSGPAVLLVSGRPRLTI